MSYSSSNVNEAELPYWLALLRAPGIGPIKFLRLIQEFPRVSEIFTTSSAQLRLLGVPDNVIAYLKQPNWHVVEKDLTWLNQEQQRYILTWQDERYPQLLRETVGAPPVLYAQGNLQLLNTPQLAIVGSRTPSPTGKETAYSFARAIAQVGLTITSGLALGIDAACHQGALAAPGATIAVLGTGLNHIYPRQHQELAQAISYQGLLLSEFGIGITAQAAHFPQRNRIISGLSVGVLVIEAAIQSGSLITARYALEQGRDVFAIPGSIHNPLAKGCHALIRQGAKLVESTQDILEEISALCSTKIPILAVESQKNDKPNLTPPEQDLLHYIGYEMTNLDTLVIRSGLTPGTVSSMLLHLELKGYVTAVPGGYQKMG